MKISDSHFSVSLNKMRKNLFLSENKAPVWNRKSNPFQDNNGSTIVIIDRKKKKKKILVQRGEALSFHVSKGNRTHRRNNWIEIFGQDHPDGSTPIHLNSIKSKVERAKEMVGGPRCLWKSAVVFHHAIVHREDTHTTVFGRNNWKLDRIWTEYVVFLTR